MLLPAFLEKLNTQAESIEFSDTMSVIEENYQFTETAFTNGNQSNEAGQNSGSCKIFAFAKLQKFSQQQTLACFGQFYREDVLQHPDATDHQNIRQFMINGWEGIAFSAPALSAK
ncbi:type III effector [Psychromonas sp. psych-6C06]|uniref:HopJ type III effector protein n=1 Tax=Psychromonas sp. psych-6C06 TaxID=2058089 RepID=UPI000C34180D|nr:HopJ type III effector protein [Psychromonas sp. psych-6C06]PKF62221.1 type III effector [Psychromonas sp. psych-6C06]